MTPPFPTLRSSELLIYYGPDGRQKCGTDASLDNASSLSWFRDVDMFRSFTISDYTFSNTAPRPVIVAALPVYDSTGRLDGILSASIDLTWQIGRAHV